MKWGMAVLAAMALCTVSTFAQTPNGNGNGVVVVTSAGGCIGFTPARGAGPDNWEVSEGKNYVMTLSGVTECNDPAITVFVQNSSVGNFCFNAYALSNGVYQGTFTVPNPSCNTMPVSYKCGENQPCNNGGTWNAKGPSLTDSVHLRASTFDANCVKTADDTNCGQSDPLGAACETDYVNRIRICHENVTQAQALSLGWAWGGIGSTCDTINCAGGFGFLECTLTAPEFDAGCNPSAETLNLPNITAAVLAFNLAIDGNNIDTNTLTVTAVSAETVVDCRHSVVVSFQSFPNPSGDPTDTLVPCSVDVTVSWQVVSLPVFDNIVNGSTVDLGCNPLSTPTADAASTNVFAHNECGSVLVVGSQFDDVLNGCSVSRTINYVAGSECGGTNVAQVTYTWKNDTTPPTLTCSNVTVNGGGACSAVVAFAVTATDDCGGGTLQYTVNGVGISSPSEFPVGDTVVDVVATDDCGNASTCQFTVRVLAQLCVNKFYDANVNGLNDDGQVVAGIKITVDDGQVGYTDANGNVCFNVVLGDHTVTETVPSSWRAVLPTSVLVLSGCNQSATFGNVCLGGSGGLTLGFWSNKNGQKVMTLSGMTSNLTFLAGLNLRNATGTAFNPTSYTQFHNWLLAGNAVNMAYMLSVQLATMELNVRLAGFTGPYGGGISGTAVIYAPGTASANINGYATINDVMAEANALLATNGVLNVASPTRTLAGALKNALDNANNSRNIVSPTPCN